VILALGVCLYGSYRLGLIKPDDWRNLGLPALPR
jgi:hypothetical protein